MIFHKNRLLADDSHEISCLFFSKIRKDDEKSAVGIGTLRVKGLICPPLKPKTEVTVDCYFYYKKHPKVKIELLLLT